MRLAWAVTRRNLRIDLVVEHDDQIKLFKA